MRHGKHIGGIGAIRTVVVISLAIDSVIQLTSAEFYTASPTAVAAAASTPGFVGNSDTSGSSSATAAQAPQIGTVVSAEDVTTATSDSSAAGGSTTTPAPTLKARPPTLKTPPSTLKTPAPSVTTTPLPFPPLPPEPLPTPPPASSATTAPLSFQPLATMPLPTPLPPVSSPTTTPLPPLAPLALPLPSPPPPPPVPLLDGGSPGRNRDPTSSPLNAAYSTPNNNNGDSTFSPATHAPQEEIMAVSDDGKTFTSDSSATSGVAPRHPTTAPAPSRALPSPSPATLAPTPWIVSSSGVGGGRTRPVTPSNSDRDVASDSTSVVAFRYPLTTPAPLPLVASGTGFGSARSLDPTRPPSGIANENEAVEANGATAGGLLRSKLRVVLLVVPASSLLAATSLLAR